MKFITTAMPAAINTGQEDGDGRLTAAERAAAGASCAQQAAWNIKDARRYHEELRRGKGERRARRKGNGPCWQAASPI